MRYRCSPGLPDEIKSALPDELQYCYVDWLRHYPDCISASGEIDGVKLVKHITEMPGVRFLLQLHELVLDGALPWTSFNSAQTLVSGVVDVIELAASGSERAANQLIALKKIVRPHMFDLPESVVKNIAERYYTSPHVARGSYLRCVMYFLKRIVTPSREGKPLTARCRVQLLETAKDDYPGLFQKAKPHWNKNSTLQSLAIKIYLSEVDVRSTPTKIDERSLKRDLAILRKWEQTRKPQAGDTVYGDVLVEYGRTDEPITWPHYSVNPKWLGFPTDAVWE